MAGYTDQVVKLDIPGEFPISIRACYDVEVEGDRRTGERAYTIDLGSIVWTMAGKSMPDLEPEEIPESLKLKILAAITVSDKEMAEALSAEDDEDDFRLSHAAGML